jgi:hypothetical protein
VIPVARWFAGTPSRPPPAGSRPSMLTFMRFVSIVLAGLALTMTSAHVLELPQKMTYTAEMYSAVNTTLYRYFAIVGGIYQIGGILAAGVTALLMWQRRLPFRWALAGFGLLLLSFVSWLVFVQPVNQQVAAAMQSSPETLPSLWMQLRGRWEYGHAAGFAIHLLGFCALAISLLRETDTAGVRVNPPAERTARIRDIGPPEIPGSRPGYP